MYRAFIVPKGDPSEQYEIPATNGEDDLDHHEFHIKLGKDHAFVVNFRRSDPATNTPSAFEPTLDGKEVRLIGTANTAGSEIHDLVKQSEIVRSWSGDDDQTYICRTGDDTWIITRKNFDTGRIERFTQSETSGLGRLDIIQ